jgi:DNA-binding MurR/RpiR family transcriptional regulator
MNIFFILLYKLTRRCYVYVMEGCLYLIKQFAPSLSPSERRAADYLVAFPTQAVQLGITALAECAGTSSAAIIRLANRLGYKGFSDLRMSLAKEVFSSEPSQKDFLLPNLSASASANDIVKTMVGLTSESVAGIDKVLDRPTLESVVEIIRKAKHVLISGIGASGVVATDLQQKLARLGILAVYTADSDMQVVQSCSLDQNDAIIAISYSGETGDVLKVAKEAKKNGTPVIAITRIGGNSLSKLAEYNLFVPNSESLFRQGATSSRINQLLVVDILYAMILTRTQDQTANLIKRTWEAVSHVSGTFGARHENDF